MIDGGLNGLFRERLTGFFFQRVETGGTGRGIPDTHYIHDGAAGWAEFKATGGWAVGLRPEQIAWGSRYARCGGRVWLAVRRQAAAGPRRGAGCDELWLVPGFLWTVAGREGLKALDPAAHLMGQRGPATWDWAGVRASLLRTT